MSLLNTISNLLPNSISNLKGAFGGPTPSLAFNALSRFLPGAAPFNLMTNAIFGGNKKDDTNTLLGMMSPSVAGVFQNMGVEPAGFAKGLGELAEKSPTQEPMNPIIQNLLLENAKGLLDTEEQEVMPVMPQQVMPNRQIPVVPQLDFYRRILS